jgi:hypothetical protein
MSNIRSITVNFDGDCSFHKATWLALAITEDRTGVPREEILMSLAFGAFLKEIIRQGKKNKFKLNLRKVNLLRDCTAIDMEES